MGASMKVAAVVIAVASVASVVAAQDSPQLRDAAERFAVGERHYEQGEYAQALREFERVYALMAEAGHPNAPVTLFNIARCYVRLGREREAIATYERFLAAGAGDARTRARAEASCASCALARRSGIGPWQRPRRASRSSPRSARPSSRA